MEEQTHRPEVNLPEQAGIDSLRQFAVNCVREYGLGGRYLPTVRGQVETELEERLGIQLEADQKQELHYGILDAAELNDEQ